MMETKDRIMLCGTLYYKEYLERKAADYLEMSTAAAMMDDMEVANQYLKEHQILVNHTQD